MDKDANMELVADEVANLLPKRDWAFDEIGTHAPNLANAIRGAIKVANESSGQDINVTSLGIVKFANRYSDYHTDAASINLDGSVLWINEVNMTKLNLTVNEFTAMLSHEIGHVQDAKTHPNIPFVKMSQDESREMEYKADQYSDPQALISYFLKDIKNDRSHYDYPSSKEDHPNHRERIVLLLGKVYGYDVFKHSGAITADGVFHPEMGANNLPMIETGQQISNWSEIEPKIHQQVVLALNKLDGMVKDGLSHDKINDFNQFVTDSAFEFRSKKEHQPILMDTPSKRSYLEHERVYDQLATSFRNDANSQLIRQKNIAIDPRMQDVYARWDGVIKEINQGGLNEDARIKLTVIAQAIFAQNVAQGSFPKEQSALAKAFDAETSYERA